MVSSSIRIRWLKMADRMIGFVEMPLIQIGSSCGGMALDKY